MTPRPRSVVRDGPGPMPFSSVNRPGLPTYRPGLQRHHILPRQVQRVRGFARMFAALGPEPVGMNDFRRNGLLLPSNETEAMRTGLPLHRGPHAIYTTMVIERVGAIEREWSGSHGHAAWVGALVALDALQKALRRELLDPACWRSRPLNRRDPALNFSHLDAMAEALWGATGEPLSA